MIKTMTISNGQKPTLEQLKEVEEAAKYPIEFDEDCEELSENMIKAFQCATNKGNRKRNA